MERACASIGMPKQPINEATSAHRVQVWAVEVNTAKHKCCADMSLVFEQVRLEQRECCDYSGTSASAISMKLQC